MHGKEEVQEREWGRAGVGGGVGVEVGKGGGGGDGDSRGEAKDVLQKKGAPDAQWLHEVFTPVLLVT